MAVSVSHPRLQIKFSSLDDVPTFPDYGIGSSEGLTFRRGRHIIDARPKVIYRPPPPSLIAIEANDEQRDSCMDLDEDEDESAASANLIGLDVSLQLEMRPKAQDEEQRENLPVSNSAPRGILKRPNEARNRVSGTVPRRVRFADGTKFPSTYTGAPSTPRHPSTIAEAEDVEMVAVKQEDDEGEFARLEGSSSRPCSSMFLGTIKTEPEPQGFANETIRSSHIPSPQSRTATPEDASGNIPSIVVTAATDPEPSIASESENEAECRPDVPVTLPQLLSTTRKYVDKCLTFAHIPTHELFLHLRGVAHFLLQSSGAKVFLRPVQKGDQETLKRLRDTLKNVLELTAIVKLEPSAVSDEMWKKSRAKCVRRFDSILKLVDRARCVSNSQLRIDGPPSLVPAVKKEEEEGGCLAATTNTFVAVERS
ncbi:uncharacterized protein SRS1_06445 [Sporisorium reilianum f. sp. reilianum]|uniref:Uncharacterized protein n=1 Tax=Sporisorium reilianum f. sp. reilianum TaxID=72559 RepID=A0A2N8U4V5_9BASI|nr:uncharacterized protein SRS1_06445 [Sporisorium reilianum f. sp. reilianum]